MRFTLNSVAALLILLTSLAVRADDNTFPEPVNSEQDKGAQPMPAAEAARRMKAPEGFSVKVFASEPDVQNPIDMAWDPQGRIWIAENYTYAERAQRFDLGLRDRVVILQDTNGDHRADKRIVFTDQVQMLTSVEVGLGGVWLMCPDKLLFIPDRDGDDRPDGPPEVVLDGFTVAEDNHHNFANGLRWGPDGWLYGRCGGSCPGRVGKPGTPSEQRVALEGGIWRVHPQTHRFEVLVHGTTNPWGHDWNSMGEGFFINTVNGHLWHLIPGAHFMRPFTLDPNPQAYQLIDMHADHWHFDTGSSWTKSRDGAANSYGGGHAHVGMMIYQGDNWPAEYRDRLFTWNIHGQRANQELLERKGSGYVARHGQDMFLAADPFFRGMELSYGPDGAVYALDWSDTGECHEHTGVHRTSGRIFRIAYDSAEHATPPRVRLQQLDDQTLVRVHLNRNEWFARQARILLMDRARRRAIDSQALETLKGLCASKNPVTAYRAVVTRHALGLTKTSDLEGMLKHQNEHLRAWAVRLITDSWPLDDVFGKAHLDSVERARVDGEVRQWILKLIDVAKSDNSGLVRLAAASSICRLPKNGHRVLLANALMKNSADADDHNLPLLVWYGLIPVANENPDWAAGLAIESQWPTTRRFLARRVAEQIETAPRSVERIIDRLVAGSDAQTRLDLLHGLADGLRGRSRVAAPRGWKAAAAKLAALDPKVRPIVRDLSVLFGDGRALGEVRRMVLDKSNDAALRRSALQTLVERNTSEIREICLAVLNEPSLNVVAAQGLARTDSAETAKALIKNYRRFRSPHRPKVIAILVSRPKFAAELLDAVEAKKIPVTHLTAYDVRQIRSLDQPSLKAKVSKLWGELRESPAAKRTRIEELKKTLTVPHLAKADLPAGRQLFNRSCAKCHRLFGVGENIGPDLTGANRNNLDYLLENIVDPSAVVSKNFRMTVLQTVDGRVLNGLVLSENEKTLTLQTQTDKMTIPLDQIDARRITTDSPMPDGLLDNLSGEEIRDLISYLMQPAQTPQ